MKLDPRRLTLCRMLEAHDAHAGGFSLDGNFGDGFLYRNNVSFKNLRDGVIHSGGAFTRDDYCNYESMPVAALLEILRSERVYYRDTVNVLRRIEACRPGRFRLSELPELRKNWMMHESSHLLCHQTKLRMGIQPANEREGVLEAQLSEAFADAVETYSNAWVTPGFHQLFFSYNSNVILSDEDDRAALRATLDVLGPYQTLTLLGLSFLHYTFLHLRPVADPKRLVRCMRLMNVHRSFSTKEAASLLRLFGFATRGNNPRFVMKTSEFFFKLNLGVEKRAKTMLKFEFLRSLERDSRWMELLGAAGRLVVDGSAVKLPVPETAAA